MSEDKKHFVPEEGCLTLDERIKMQKSGSVPSYLDMVGELCLPEEYRYGCLYSVKIFWDQWAKCTLKCEHGEYEAVSDFLNITEAMIRAALVFRNDPKHQEITDED